MEIWDAYNSDFEKIDGMTLIRGEEGQIPDGVYHLVCHILVKHHDGTFLIMQRDLRKPYPGMWEATAGGSALKGETPLECAFRELREETVISSDRLTEIGRVLHYGHKTIYVEYLCNTAIDKSSIVLQDGETSAYKWISVNDLRKMSKDELATQRMQDFIEELSH